MLGTSVSNVGDFNYDFIGDDYILGAPNHYQGNNKNGIAYLVFGASSYTAIDLSSDIATAGKGFKVCTILISSTFIHIYL